MAKTLSDFLVAVRQNLFEHNKIRYRKSTTTSAGNTSGTTAIDSSASSFVDDYFNGCYFRLLSGTGARQKEILVTDFVGSSGTFTLAETAGVQIGSGVLYEVFDKGIFTDTAIIDWINAELALKHSAIIPVIAETGGQNVMLVDSTALPEQVVTDAIFSAFNSAGQRCSALRVIVVQEDIALKVKALLIGSMEQLIVGSPDQFKTDVGPVISEQAKNELNNYIAESVRSLVCQVPIDHLSRGHYVSPSLLDIAQLSELTVERFGPILHFYTYKAEELDDVINQINSLGFGLTFGIHSRMSSKIDYIIERINVGNIYVNRNMIGATVGVQPFGGQGLSGTGLKAGGPHYLQQFVTEKTVSNNVTAMGGNASLLALGD